MFGLPPLDLPAARALIAQLPAEPDETLDHSVHGPYLRKWLVMKLADGSARYVHQFLRSDADGEMHDHPWANVSLVVEGGYWDVTQAGRQWLSPGDRLIRHATDFHRVELAPGLHPYTIFDHGPKINAWGFLGDDGQKIDPKVFMADSGAMRR